MTAAADIKNLIANPALVRERRAQIIAGAVQLFAEQGYHQTTVQEVAKRAGISTGLIYQYVRDKEDLLLLSILDVLESYAVEIPAAMDGKDGPLEQCCAAFRAYCRVVDARREATVLAYQSTKSLSSEHQHFIMEAERKTNRLIGDCIRDGIDQGLFRPVDIDIATYQLIMHAHAWALKYWHFVKHTDLEAYISKGLDFFLQAMLTEAGWERIEQTGKL